MFKLAIKSSIFLLLVLSVGIFLTGNKKVEANTGQCPSNPTAFGQAQNNLNWGVTPTYNGSHGGNMAGLIISAYDASNNQSIDNVYHINSGISATDPYWGTVNGVQTNLNDRIFQDIAGNFSNRTNSFQSQTNTPMNFFSTACTGWDAFGPEDLNSPQVGNGYVLDCGPPSNATHFWFSSLRPNPIGDGVNGQNGYWSISVNGPSGSYTIPHYTEGSSNYGANYFTVTNGQNTFVQMIWHPIGWHLSGDSTVDGQHGTINVQPGTTHTFRHKVTNTAGDPANYAWSVVGNVPGGKPAGTASGVDSGGTNPNTANDVFSVPAGTEGNTYCEHIQFSNATGPGTAQGSSSQACVHVTNQQGSNSASCSKIDEYNYGNFTTVNGAGQTIQHVTRTLVETSNPGAVNNDTNGAIYAYAPNSSGSTNKNDQVWNITATAASFTYYTTRQYQQTNGNWAYIDNNGNASSTPTRNAHTVSNCYHASCSTPQVIDGRGPGGTIIAGQPFRLLVPITNDNGDPNAETIPVSPGGFAFSLTEPPDDSVSGFTGHGTGFSLNVGETETATIYKTAPSDVRYFTLSFYPDLYGSSPIGNGCSVTIPVYQQFSASVTPVSNFSYSEADAPTSVTYGENITQQWVNPPAGMGSHNIYNWATANFYKKSASGAVSTPCAPSSYASPGPYGSPVSGAAIWSNNCAIPVGSYQAGDEYCTDVGLQWGGGYVGPDGGVVGGTPGASDSKCPRVTNEPYFKISNSSISAGGDFDSCTTAGGTLAGYNNNQDNGGTTDRGASVQLGALSIVPSGISGVASSQPVGATGSGGTDAMRLTFANNTSLGAPYGADTDTPTLGGNAGTCQTLTNKHPTGPTTALGGSTNVATVGNGQYTSGNLTIGTPNTTETMAAGHQVEIFATGNVYISSSIKYDNGGATVGTVPSLVIHATGNIYIDPSVTNLAGVYIAQQGTQPDGSPDTTTGKIYTCGVNSGGVFSPMQTSGNPNIYNNCHDQLVVYGSFVADQINLMRTFGSLRDETPVATSPPTQPAPLLCSNQGVVSALTATGTINTPDDLRNKLNSLILAFGLNPADYTAIVESLVQAYATGSMSLNDIQNLIRSVNPSSSLGLGNGTQTCAAEVFRFSPQIYLSNPDGGSGGGGGGGMPPAQSITSLPPVL